MLLLLQQNLGTAWGPVSTGPWPRTIGTVTELQANALTGQIRAFTAKAPVTPPPARSDITWLTALAVPGIHEVFTAKAASADIEDFPIPLLFSDN